MARESHKKAAREDAEETRRTILRTAQQLFMDYGYRAVSTRQIADACGLTQPALYHHFHDKQELYVEVMKEEINRTRAALERIARRSDSVSDRLRQVIRYLLSSTQHDLGMMFHDIQQELNPQAQQTLNEQFQTGLIAPIASVFEDGLQQGLLRDRQHGGVDAVTTTYLFMSMLSQFLTRSQYSRHLAHTRPSFPSSEVEQAEMIVQILLYGLATDQERQKRTMPEQ